MEVSLIYKLATCFRAAIEATQPSKLPITFNNFPHGSCGDAALLLAKYLEESGHSGFNYILGERHDSSHAWLQKDALIVDITGDQFSDMPHPVFVGAHSDWHASFNGCPKHIADFEIYDAHTRSTLHAAYHEILLHLKI